MRINGQVPYGWDHLNQVARESLGVPHAVQVFKSTPHALFDICLGLHLKFSHKRKVISQLGQGSHLHNLQIEMAKLGVRFKKEFEVSPEGDIDKDVKATLAYVCDRDDALTAEVFDRSKELAALAEKSIFRIHIFHHSYQVRPEILSEIGPYDIFVISINADMTVAVMGDKCLLPAFSANSLRWDLPEKELRTALSFRRKEDLRKVIDFESNGIAEAEAWFPPDFEDRLFDRAVVTFPEFDGAAVVELFHQMHGLTWNPAGQRNLLETTSFSRWKNKLWLDQAQDFGRSPEDIRGTVSISLAALTDGFQKHLQETVNELKTLSH